MNQIIGVTELQRRFRSVFDDVTKKGIPYVLTRGSKPEAVLLPYEEYVKYKKLSDEEADQKFDAMVERLSKANTKFSDEEVSADVEEAIQEVRKLRRQKEAGK
jgi:prevent-host-death family protein